MSQSENLRTVYEQYMEHCRFQLQSRLAFTTIYGALVAGALGFMGSIESISSRLGLIVGILSVSLLGLVLCHTWRIPYLWFSRLAERILIEEWKLEKYRRFYGKNRKEFRIKFASGSGVFHFFYIFMESIFVFLLVVTLRDDIIGIAIGIPLSVVVLFLLTMIYFCVFKRREEKLLQEIDSRWPEIA